jgi:ankyrin repeat protein
MSGCGDGKDQKARAAIHSAGFAYSVNDFLRAAREGKAEIVGQFLTAGMNPGAADERGMTAIAAAAAGGHGHVVKLLLSRGAKPNPVSPEGQTALIAAAQSGDVQAVKALLDAGADASRKDSTGMSPLAAAVLAGQTETVKALAQQSDSTIDDALQLAAVKGHSPVISILLDLGASPLSVSADGRTPLMYAADYGHLEAAKLLRQRGAPLTTLDAALKTPADHAEENGHADLAAYLREPDRTADPIGLETSPARITEIPDMASMAALTDAITLVDYRSRTLPLSVIDVPEGDATASVQMLTGEDKLLTVSTGQTIPETSLTVDSMKRRLLPSRRGPGRMIDVSELRLSEPSTGRHFLVVKGLPAMTGEGCGIVKLKGNENLIEFRTGDEIRAGAFSFKVKEIRPLRLVLERSDTKEALTITRPGGE